MDGVVEVAVTVLITHDDQILLGRLPSGFWSLPEAPLAYGQSLTHAGVQLAQTCGIEVADVARVLNAPYVVAHSTGRHVVTLALTAKLAEGELSAPWRWWFEHDLPASLAPGTQAVLDQIFRAPARLN